MSESLKFHPLADLFPLMEGKEFDEFVEDIKKSGGLREQICLYQDQILDGRNRYRALQRLGMIHTCFTHPCAYFIKLTVENDEAARAYVISKNLHRRHLTAEQKRDLLVKLVAAQPEKADRVLAREAKVDHKQVSRARRKAEATGAIAPVAKRTGADGKARRQPAKRKRGKPLPLPDDPEGREERERLVAAIKTELAAAEQNKQEALSAMKGLIEVLMQAHPQVRVQYFTLLWGSFRDEMIEAQTVAYEMAVPPKPDTADAPPPKRGRGRPPGSKNKPKAAPVEAYTAPADNGGDPEASAKTMKAKLAGLDDGLDIPESFPTSA